MNINKIRLSTFSFNERAIKSYKKCGFTVEGVLKNEIFKIFSSDYSDIKLTPLFYIRIKFNIFRF